MHDILPCLLFVPGMRPDRVAGALASGAALVCLDLEDSVPADGKIAARTAAGLADLVALADAGAAPRAVLIPMVEAAAEIEIVRGTLGSAPLIPLIETVRGLDAAADIARAAGVVAVMLGGADLAAELGVVLAWEPLLLARSRLVMACAAAGVAAIDVPWIDLDDDAGLRAEADRARTLGFTGKAAIHPKQIAGIDAAFRPSPAEVAEAHAALATFADAGGGAVRFRGRMLEAPLMARYRRIVGT